MAEIYSIDWLTISEYIVPGLEVEHHLSVWAECDQYKLYVNRFQGGEFTDAAYVEESTFGAAHGATDTVSLSTLARHAFGSCRRRRDYTVYLL